MPQHVEVVFGYGKKNYHRLPFIFTTASAYVSVAFFGARIGHFTADSLRIEGGGGTDQTASSRYSIKNVIRRYY